MALQKKKHEEPVVLGIVFFPPLANEWIRVNAMWQTADGDVHGFVLPITDEGDYDEDIIADVPKSVMEKVAAKVMEHRMRQITRGSVDNKEEA